MVRKQAITAKLHCIVFHCATPHSRIFHTLLTHSFTHSFRFVCLFLILYPYIAAAAAAFLHIMQFRRRRSTFDKGNAYSLYRTHSLTHSRASNGEVGDSTCERSTTPLFAVMSGVFLEQHRQDYQSPVRKNKIAMTIINK